MLLNTKLLENQFFQTSTICRKAICIKMTFSNDIPFIFITLFMFNINILESIEYWVIFQNLMIIIDYPYIHTALKNSVLFYCKYIVNLI